MALGPADAFVTPTMARPGDAVVVTKGAAIETTALFAATFPDRLAAGVGEETVRAADALFESMTVVPEAVARPRVRSARRGCHVDARRDRGRRDRRVARGRDRLERRDPRGSGTDPDPAGGARGVRSRRDRSVHGDQRRNLDRHRGSRAGRRLRRGARRGGDRRGRSSERSCPADEGRTVVDRGSRGAAHPSRPGSVLGRLRSMGRGRGRRLLAPVPESLGTLRRRWT